jgi:NADPH-dependent glutamate synthase beta subunit-like oxidoreductase
MNCAATTKLGRQFATFEMTAITHRFCPVAPERICTLHDTEDSNPTALFRLRDYKS